MRDHTKLRAFELARELAISVYRETSAFPSAEQFGLTAQMRRAAVSVGSNIVEGAARPSLPDYLRFLHIAYGSARELEFQTELAFQLKFLEPSRFELLSSLASETAKVLHGLIRALDRVK